MSRLEQDLLLLTKKWTSFQIEKYLQFFNLLGPCLPFSPHQNPNYPSYFSSHNSNSRNLIIQQNLRIIYEYSLTQEIVRQISQEKVYESTKYDESPNSNQLKIENFFQQEFQEVEKIKKKNKKNKKKFKKANLKQKRQKQLKRNQNQNSKRNIIPNQIHQMLSILFKKKRSFTMVQDLIKKLSPSQSQFSSHRFYLYQSLFKNKINHYINEQGLKILFTHLEPSYIIYSKEQQTLYNKIGLVLIDHFLRSESTLIILNSQRIKSQNKLDHLKTKRYLQVLLSDLIQSNGN